MYYNKSLQMDPHVSRLVSPVTTLDLVLTHGLPIEDFNLNDHIISDRKPILFNIPVSCCSVNPVNSLQCFPSFLPMTGTEFVTSFNEVCIVSDSVFRDMGVDEHLQWLHSACKDVLDIVAPLKTKQRKVRSDPWLNDEIRSLRQICRQAERKWMKNKLQMYYIFKEALKNFQRLVQGSRFFIIRQIHNHTGYNQ